MLHVSIVPSAPCLCVSAIHYQCINSAPGLVPAKAKYMSKDLQRNARYFGVNLKVPSRLSLLFTGKGSLPMQRFITSVQLLMPDKVQLNCMHLYHIYYYIFAFMLRSLLTRSVVYEYAHAHDGLNHAYRITSTAH